MASIPIKISKIGFCNFKFEDGQIPEGWEAPSDISNHYGIEFSFEYSWNGNHCYITNIQSEPIELDNTRTINRNIELQSIEFKNDKCLTIDFNSTSLVNSQSEFDTTIYEDEPKVYLGENENLEYEVTNSSYMLANFKYENRSQSGNQEDGFSTVVYYIDIPNIKIPKPSKYENNVIFTEEGVKELVGEVESKVSKDGDTMTGSLIIKSTNIANGTTPSSDTYADKVLCLDTSDDVHIGYLQPLRKSDGASGLRVAARLNDTNNYTNVLDLGVNKNTDHTQYVYTNCPDAWCTGIGAVKKSGDTMTGNLTVTNTVPEIITKSSISNVAVSLSTSSDNKNHGVWSYGYSSNGTSLTSNGKWMIYRDGSGNIIVNGSAEKWTTPRSFTIGNKSQSVDGSQNITWSLADIGVATSNHTHNYLPLSGGDLTGTLNIKNGLSNSITLAKNGDTTIGGTLTVSGATTLNGNLTISSLGKLILLNSAIYGDSLPSNSQGTQGQIFFVRA